MSAADLPEGHNYSQYTRAGHEAFFNGDMLMNVHKKCHIGWWHGYARAFAQGAIYYMNENPSYRENNPSTGLNNPYPVYTPAAMAWEAGYAEAKEL